MIAAIAQKARGVVEDEASGGGFGVAARPFEGGTLLLLHTVGAKSGQPRLSPLAYLTVDGMMLIVGTYAGAPKAPAWVQNLRANPRAHIEIGTESYDFDVRELPDGEREATYPRIVELAPVFAEYQAKTTRTIPLFELTRA